jgi:outer membrane protein assembly factor BamC
MNRTSIGIKAAIVLSIILMSGCDSVPFVDNSSDYKATGRARPLEVPPDLTSISSSDTYSVPGGSTTYSSYSQNQGSQGIAEERILANPDNVKLERAGSQRWLVVQAPPEKVWPVIRDFWSELGFAVRVENPQTGVMETEWVDPTSITKDDKGNYLEKFQGWLDKLNTLQNRQKFRTRIDRGTAADTTEIYLSHRSVADVQDDGKIKVRTTLGDVEQGYAPSSKPRTKADEARASAEDIDAELLRRLMVRLGVSEQTSRSVISNASMEQRAKLLKETDGSLALEVTDPFDRAWRRVGLALDRVGFIVEDRDRSNGLFYVRYTDIESGEGASNKKKGLLSSLKFWGDEDPDADKAAGSEPKKDTSDESKDKKSTEKRYSIKVDETGNTTKVTVVDKDGNRNRSATANRILNLLYEQLI